MIRNDLDRWFLKEDGVAVLWRPSGLLRRIREIPEGAQGLRLDGGDELEASGSPLEDDTIGGILHRTAKLLEANGWHGLP